MSKKEKKAKGKIKGVWADFKAFIARGNVLDMAVGVVIGGAFGAIVTAVVNVLLSICTWAVPGGLSGLITVLPAANPIQAGVTGIGQSFAASELPEMTIAYAASQGVTITQGDTAFINWQTALLSKYTLYGGTYAYNAAAIINWGAVINAIISFLIIAIVLFVIVKAVATIKRKSEEAVAKMKEKVAHKEETEEVAEEAAEEKAE